MDWILCTTKKPNTHKVKFKDCHGNQFIGNYSKDTDDYYAYGINRAIDGVIKWMPQNESESEDNTPSFSIEDLRDAYNAGYWTAEDGLKFTQGKTFESYMKDNHNIDI